MEHQLERDCTPRCKSFVHANLIQGCVCTATPSQLKAYAVWLCHNFATVTDELGRNLLHAASSNGKWEIVEWLIKQCHIDFDIKDHESGWSSLHRSFFYGQLASARVLCMNGANLRSVDHEGFTPLDLVMKDRLPYIEYIPSDPSDVYAWGLNFNYNLGLGNSQNRVAPEILEVFRKDFIDIKQVQICKFHSAFLSTNGKVYTCGYGHGGRLGQETEDISLVPSPVKGLGSHSCVQVATGQDHLILLLENGQVWSCGHNVYHVLGHIPPTDKVLSPKPISLKFLKGNKVIGVKAARFHSVIYTLDSVYTFGLNAGQLGHAKGDRTQIHPRQVSGLYSENCKITHVEVSDGATVCATNRGEIYVLHEYQIRKIASRQLDIQKLSVVGGHLDSRVDAAGVREGGGLELKVLLLANSGKVYLWRQSDPYLRRCIFTSQKEILVSDIHINHYSVGLISTKNEGYLGQIVPFKGKRAAPPPSTLHPPSNFSNRASSGLVILLDTDDCHFIKPKKLPNIYRATSITSDSKGRNFAVLQSNPKMGLIEVPWLSNSRMLQDFARLLSETHVQDEFHDIIVKVDKREFAAHKYILASRSEYFKKQFNKEAFVNGIMQLENTKAEAFEQAMKFIYTNNCDFLISGFEVKWGINKENGKKKKSGTKSSKAASPVLILLELSKKLGLNYLAKRLENVKLIDGRIYTSDADPPKDLIFKRNYLSTLHDACLISSDGVVFKCHKCILIARLDYFHSMLNTCWSETANLEQINLPIPSQVLEAILDYLYLDDSAKVNASDDVNYLSQTLIFADQLIIPVLKEMCEVSLVRLITLKNSAELLEISSLYNALQLKRSCMQFICLNLAAMIESKVLEVLSDDVMEELTTYYRNMVPGMRKRKFVSGNAPSREDLVNLEKQFPVSDLYSFERSRSESHENRTKNRRRTNSWRSEAKEVALHAKDSDNSNSSQANGNQNIILDIVTPETAENKLEPPIWPSPKGKVTKPIPISPKVDKQGQWVMKCPTYEEVASLDTIMSKEKELIVLQKKSSSVAIKRMPHLSQKQKKMTKPIGDILQTSCSPPSRCPWAKLPEQSPPSPSFWDSLSRQEWPSTNPFSNPLKSLPEVSANKIAPSQENTKDVVISLHDIQKAEEQKQRRTLNPKIKPLHLINIEDQAIEELCAMYNINENHKEKITVSRVQPEEIASPVWKRKY
uniref:Inhibitor of Bruton tyrosine kinase n=1 Tax=Parasteatoda tepidariorum TaxID=114398 RepID=A0A2L2YAE7_PARTP